MANKDETLPKPLAWVRRHPDGALTAEYLEDEVIEPVRKNSGAWVPLYTAATLRQAAKRANYALLMRLHEENKHKHNFFHCAAVKLMEESQ